MSVFKITLLILFFITALAFYFSFSGAIKLPNWQWNGKMPWRVIFRGIIWVAFLVLICAFLWQVWGEAVPHVPKKYSETVESFASEHAKALFTLAGLAIAGLVLWFTRPRQAAGSAQPGAAATGTAAVTGVLSPGHVIGGQWLPKTSTFGEGISKGVKTFFVASIVAGIAWIVFMQSPSDWRLVHGEAYIPARGLVFSGALFLAWIIASERKDGILGFWMFWITLTLLVVFPVFNYHSVDILFSPVREKFPELEYWTKFPDGKKILFWHIWVITLFISILAGMVRKFPWGVFILLTPVLFLWNQIASG